MENIDLIKEVLGAIEAGDIGKIKSIISANRTILNAMTPYGTFLHVSATYGKYEVAEYLLYSGIDINAKDDFIKAGAIVKAAVEGYIDIVALLLKHDAEMDVSEPSRNPLFSAIYGGHKNIVELLINNGIDISVKYTGESMKDMGAYEFAIERGESEIAALLKAHLDKTTTA